MTTHQPAVTGVGERGSAWDRILADPRLEAARKKLSADEIMTIIRHVWAAEEAGPPLSINVNGHEHTWTELNISHEQICTLAAQPVHASVTWSARVKAGKISGLTVPGRTVSVYPGMNIDCIVTGAA